MKRVLSLITAALTVTLVACEGQLAVELSRGDALTISELQPEIRGVILQTDGGAPTRFDTDALSGEDLLAWTVGERRALLDLSDASSARYTGVGLVVAATGGRVRFADDTQERNLEPVATDGPIAVVDFRVEEDEEQTLWLRLEPHFSVTDPRLDGVETARFRPVIRAVSPGDARQLSGVVSRAVLESAECRPDAVNAEDDDIGAAVYLFPAALGQFTDYVEGGAFNPLAAGALRRQEDGDYGYVMADVAAGGYVAALFCFADLDAPDRLDGLAALRAESINVDAPESVFDIR
jgi:hypothetical protein